MVEDLFYLFFVFLFLFLFFLIRTIKILCFIFFFFWIYGDATKYLALCCSLSAVPKRYNFICFIFLFFLFLLLLFFFVLFCFIEILQFNAKTNVFSVWLYVSGKKTLTLRDIISRCQRF